MPLFAGVIMYHVFSLALVTLFLFMHSHCIAADGFHIFQHQDHNQKNRPYIVYQPETLPIHEARPLLVHLHGAILTDTIKSQPLESVKQSRILNLAKQGQYYVLFPFGDREASWFNPNGLDMIMTEIQSVQNSFNIDKNKIFLSGFSDGASGTFYIASTRPDNFAGFIAFNGSLPVAAHLGYTPLYLQNINHKPFYIINTQEDFLYPAHMMQPVIDELKQHHHHITFHTPKGQHHLSYLDETLPEIINFINHHHKTIPTTLTWESDGKHENGSEWLRIISIDEQGTAQDWHRPYSLKLFNDKANLGIQFHTHAASPFTVAHIQPNSTAEKMGVKIGDQVIQIDSTELNHPYAPYLYLANKRAGEKISLTIMRNGQATTLTGQLNAGYHYQVFEKHTPSGKVKAEIHGTRLHLSTSRIKEFVLYLNLLPPSIKIQSIVLNGKIIPIPPHQHTMKFIL